MPIKIHFRLPKSVQSETPPRHLHGLKNDTDGSVSAARRVYVFTTALAVLCVFGLFDETGFVALILTSYAAVVARSHWIQLCEAATPALGYASVVGEDSPAKPAADKV